jgi:hypothetical protein
MLRIASSHAVARRTLAAWLLACTGVFAADRIEPDDFAELHALVQPKLEESAWLSIAWRTDLWQAREQAAAEGKPILLWEMDGHPLGCT